MQGAYTLLIMAMTLLTSVTGANIDQNVKDNAIQIANSAIAYAQQVIAQGETPVAPASTPAPAQPVFGSVPDQTTPAIPAPTCTLVATSSPYDWHGDVGSVSWTSTNATEAKGSQMVEDTIVRNITYTLNPVSSGTIRSIEMPLRRTADYPVSIFKATFKGPGGETKCEEIMNEDSLAFPPIHE